MLQPDAQKTRVLYLDLLRIFAALAVITLHVSAVHWYEFAPSSYEWQVCNFYDSIARWVVNIFVMVSGALFLSKSGEISLSEICGKYVLRIVTAFMFWSVLYAAVDFMRGVRHDIVIERLIAGHGHLWFLPMIASLYLIIPFLKKLVSEDRLTKYFLLLSLVFTIILSQTDSLLALYAGDSPIGSGVRKLSARFKFYFTLGFSSYYVCGYYLDKTEFSPRTKRIVYLLSILGFAATIFLSSAASLMTGKATEEFYKNFSANVMLESIGVFLFFKTAFGSRKFSLSMQKVIYQLSKCSFGAYLAHMLIIDQLRNAGITPAMFNLVWSIPLFALFIAALSFLISYVLGKIPFVNKYFV
ncbi:MAG: acyltransferase family protein [Synergistaceae bacterium]|nr:acyltransferase family protein [Synergistaceae bacterium]